jgi:hypothetical protein
MNGVGVQLDLFSPDRLSLGEAREALNALDLERAAMLYRQIIARWPEAGEAREGLAAAARWNEILSRIESGDPRSAPRTLWDEIREATASTASLPEGFRAGLLRRVRDMLRNLDTDPVPPDLSQGDVLLELDRPAEAVHWAREAMERFRDERIRPRRSLRELKPLSLGEVLRPLGRTDDLLEEMLDDPGT